MSTLLVVEEVEDLPAWTFAGGGDEFDAIEELEDLLPFAAVPPAPSAPTYSVPIGCTAKVYTLAGTYRGTLPGSAVTFRDEGGGFGTGKVDLTVHPGYYNASILSAGRVVVVARGTRLLYGFILDATSEQSSDALGVTALSWSGSGRLVELDDEGVWTEHLYWRELSSERAFDYGARSGVGVVDWLARAKWRNARGIARTKSIFYTRRKKSPLDWLKKENVTQWIGLIDPNHVFSASRTSHFRSSFTTTVTADLVLEWAAGGAAEFQIDNEVVDTIAGPFAYRNTRSVALEDFPAGDHTIAIKVTGRTPVVIALVATADSDGNPKKILRRTLGGSTWKVYTGTDEPGWTAGEIATQLITEAQARGAYSGVTLGFTTVADSRGQAWGKNLDIAFPIGMTGSQWIDDLQGTGLEAWADPASLPALKVMLAQNRGADLRAYVRLTALRGWSYDGSWARVRNVALVQHRRGWVQITDAASIASYRRRSTALAMGGELSATAATQQGTQALSEISTPEQTYAFDLRADTGQQPYEHFNIGDTVSVSIKAVFVAVVVKAITLAFDTDSGAMFWQIEAVAA